MPHLEYALPAHAGEHAQLKSRVAGLLVACPLTQDNPGDCPFQTVRRQPLRERYHWLESLQPKQVRSFLNEHAACIVRKEHDGRGPA